MAKGKGYFILQRALLDSELWTGEPFTRGQAWADLIGRANYETRETWIGARVVQIPRGTLFTTYEELAGRWHWSKKKTMRFVKELEKAEMCTAKSTTKGTAIFLDNYAKYQLQGTAKDTTEEPRGNREGTAGELSTIICKKERNKEGENARASARPPRNITKNPDGSYTEILPTGESVLYPPWAPPESFEEEG